jgi:hypothetical protein
VTIQSEKQIEIGDLPHNEDRPRLDRAPRQKPKDCPQPDHFAESALPFHRSLEAHESPQRMLTVARSAWSSMSMS